MAEGSVDVGRIVTAGTGLLVAGVAIQGIREGLKPEEPKTPNPPPGIPDIYTEHQVTIASPEMIHEAATIYGGSEKQWRVPFSSGGEAIEYALYYDGTMQNEPERHGTTIRIPEGVLADIVVAGDPADKKYIVVGKKDLTIPGVKTALLYFQESPVNQQYNTTELAGLWQEVTFDPEKNEWIAKTDWSPVQSEQAANAPVDVPDKVSVPPEVPVASGLTPEQKQLVEVTARHLAGIYGDTMDAEVYPDEAAKIVFFAKLTEIGLELNPDNQNLANQIAAAMNLETDKTFSPKIKNPTSGATGLIQFMPQFAPDDVGKTTDELAAMNPLEQLKYVKEYLAGKQQEAEQRGKGKMRTVNDVYWAIFGPSYMGERPDKVAYPSGSPGAAENQVHDLNNDGAITVGEAVQNVIRMAVNQGEKEAFLTSDGDPTPEAVAPSPVESEKEKMDRRIEEAGADREVMEEIVNANVSLLNEPPSDVPDGFGNGWCLLGVRLTLEDVYPDFQDVLLHYEDGSGVGSAYKARERFEAHPEFFRNVPIDSLKDLYALEPGSVIVYPPGNTSYDLVSGVHHGHISIVIDNDFKGHVETSSDHTTSLDTDLINLALDHDTLPTVWVPVKQRE